IERLVHWIDQLEASAAEALEQLLFDHLGALHDCPPFDRAWVDMRKSREVVERVKQLLDQVSLPTGLRFRPLANRPLAIVLVFGCETKIAVLLGCETALKLAGGAAGDSRVAVQFVLRLSTRTPGERVL